MQAGPIKKRPGLKFVAELPKNEKFVAITEHQERIYVASEKSIFLLKERKPLFGVFKRKARLMRLELQAEGDM